ncbi:hypothetical protein XFUD_12250 (plasmid) [Xylella fastidiosa]|nr:hypothetical protein XFUD_12250 [Xylella fastidiosa]OCA56903.1 hypothetical protein AA93_12310 [Xylella fastidiosa subsp. pauca 11399]ALR03237.1 hypothetical protein OY18_13160 [Xylella fastidiosa]KXB10335.1 hypothetical protein ADT29_00205 [Xylella fastidiosa]KXB18642.1 hypothetical protein ADT28_00205 [Xylella fastidiosa]
MNQMKSITYSYDNKDAKIFILGMSVIALMQAAVSILLKTDELSSTLVYVLMKLVPIILGIFGVYFGAVNLILRKIQAKKLIFIILGIVLINFSSYFLGYLLVHFLSVR